MVAKWLLGGQVVKALDYRPWGPRFQPHYSNRDVFTGVYSALPKKASRYILRCFHLKLTPHPSEGM